VVGFIGLMVFVEGGKRQTIFGKALAAYRLHEISERDEKGNVSFARMDPPPVRCHNSHVRRVVISMLAMFLT